MQRFAGASEHRIAAFEGALRRWMGHRPPRRDEQLVPNERFGDAGAPEKIMERREESLLARVDLRTR